MSVVWACHDESNNACRQRKRLIKGMLFFYLIFLDYVQMVIGVFIFLGYFIEFVVPTIGFDFLFLLLIFEVKVLIVFFMTESGLFAYSLLNFCFNIWFIFVEFFSAELICCNYSVLFISFIVDWFFSSINSEPLHHYSIYLNLDQFICFDC